MRSSKQKIAAELIHFLEGNAMPLHAASWKKTLARLNQQHNQIRAWNLNQPSPIGWRLLK